MSEPSSAVTLIKILVGTAWLDGQVQPQEHEYLVKVAQRVGVADEPQLQPYLHGLQPIPKQECYGWVKNYLGSRPTPEQTQQLIEDISGLIYSDSDVAVEEAKLLMQLEDLKPDPAQPQQFGTQVTHAIQSLYQRCLKGLGIG